MIYEIIIKVNISEKYFIKPLLSILNKELNKNKIDWIYDYEKNIYTINSNLNYNSVHENILNKLTEKQSYIKNIYPEYGNKWYFLFKIMEK